MTLIIYEYKNNVGLIKEYKSILFMKNMGLLVIQ
jgi:hypothetical protein